MSERDQDQSKNEFDNPLDDESASIKGMGWDILGGGPDDPYGIHSEVSEGPSAMGENPFADDDEVDAILESIGVVGRGPEKAPEDAFFDRGRGPESPEPSPPAGETPEAPPRDLTPEELGRIEPAVPAADPVMMSQPPTSPGMPTDAIAPSTPLPPETESAETAFAAETPVESASESVPAPTMPSGIPGEVDVDALLSEPEPMEPLPDAGLAGRIEERPAVPAAPAPPPKPRSSSIPRIASAQSFKVDDPFVTVPRPVRSKEPDQAPDAEIEKLLITPERINALWDEIEETFDIVVADVRGDFDTTDAAIADLKEARELLLAGSENYDNAEELVVQVRARLRRETKVRQWARTRGTWIFLYLVFWLIILAMSGWALVQFQPIFADTRLPTWLVDSWLPALGGGLGGVVGAMWVLIKHIAKKRDFDPIHTPWYITNPFMGMALGFITYLIMRVSLSGLGGIIGTPNLGLETGSSGDISTGASPTVSITLYLLSVVVGFQQNVLWSLIDRFINAIIPDPDKENKPSGSGSQSSTPPSAESTSPAATSDRAG